MHVEYESIYMYVYVYFYSQNNVWFNILESLKSLSNQVWVGHSRHSWLYLGIGRHKISEENYLI